VAVDGHDRHPNRGATVAWRQSHRAAKVPQPVHSLSKGPWRGVPFQLGAHNGKFQSRD